MWMGGRPLTVDTAYAQGPAGASTPPAHAQASDGLGRRLPVIPQRAQASWLLWAWWTCCRAT